MIHTKNFKKTLSLAQELELVGEAKQNSVKQWELIEHFKPLIKKIASKYASESYEFSDLLKAGEEGVLRAIQDFDTTKGFRFSTYARWWIISYVTNFNRANSRPFSISVNLGLKLKMLKDITEKFELENCRTPTLNELSSISNLSPACIYDLRKYASPAKSLDSLISENYSNSNDDCQKYFDIPDNERSEPDELVSKVDSIFRIKNCIKNLEPIEQKIISMRYGLDGCSAMTLAQIGEKTGYTSERIRQIQRLAEAKLRAMVC